MARLWLFGVMFFLTTDLCAQKNAILPQSQSHVWKRRLSRYVDSRDSLGANKHFYRRKCGDTTLIKQLLDAVLQNKVAAYHNTEIRFTTLSDKQWLLQALHRPPDTVLIFDPETGVEKMRIDTFDFKISEYPRFRVAEEWIFDPTSRTTDIKLLGIALCQDIYIDTIYEGTRTLCWIKWNDLQRTFKASDSIANTSLQKHIWTSYFQHTDLSIDSLTSLPETKWTRHAIRHIFISDTISKLPTESIYEENDSSLVHVFYEPASKGQLNVYSNSDMFLSQRLPFDNIKITDIPDTTIILDDRSSPDDSIVLIHHSEMYSFTSFYNVSENWHFYPENGTIHINIRGIQPCIEQQYFQKIKNIRWWVRYDDVKNILDLYEQYNPLYNLSTSLWQSYLR
jgi:hypothetical protein